MSNRTSIKYPGTTTSTSEIHINNMYIRYTFLLDVAVLQIRQVLWAIPLPVTFSLAVKALSIRLRSSLGLLRWRGNFLWHPAKPLLENRVVFVHCIIVTACSCHHAALHLSIVIILHLLA